MDTTVKDRLKAYLSANNISMAEFGRRIGVSGAYVTSMRKSIQPDKIDKIKKEFPDLDVDWLLTGKESNAIPIALEDGASAIGSPCFDAVTLQGGAGRGTGMEALTPDMAVGRMLLPGLPTGSDIPYIQVRGESMVNHRDPSRSIPEGAWVGVKATQSSAIRWGEVYAVMTTDGPIVKKLMPSESEGCIRCVSFNEEGGYLPFDLPVGEIIAPLYKVVGVVSIKVL